METREQLLAQHTEWTTKYVEAEERLGSLLPPIADSGKDKELTTWVPTKESLVEFEKAERDINRALVKLRQIREKLYKLR